MGVPNTSFHLFTGPGNAWEDAVRMTETFMPVNKTLTSDGKLDQECPRARQRHEHKTKYKSVPHITAIPPTVV